MDAGGGGAGNSSPANHREIFFEKFLSISARELHNGYPRQVPAHSALCFYLYTSIRTRVLKPSGPMCAGKIRKKIFARCRPQWAVEVWWTPGTWHRVVSVWSSRTAEGRFTWRNGCIRAANRQVTHPELQSPIGGSLLPISLLHILAKSVGVNPRAAP